MAEENKSAENSFGPLIRGLFMIGVVTFLAIKLGKAIG
jgi:hypothetical protein